MITIEIPDHMSIYRNNRVEAGLSSKISIDPCIFVEIWQLWHKDIITYGSCCGHNGKNPSFVNVDESNIQQMLDMGYLPNHYDLQRMDTFALKSAGGQYDEAGESNCTIFDVSQQRELLKAFADWRLEHPYSDYNTIDYDIDEFLKAFNCG
jgi:hypothetical protein